MKKIYYCQLFTADNGWANDAVRFACLSNGGNYSSLKDIATNIEMDLKKYPTSAEMYSVTVSGNKLLMDKGQQCILEIEEREVFELAPTLERNLDN
jgi:hypothetical protein